MSKSGRKWTWLIWLVPVVLVVPMIMGVNRIIPDPSPEGSRALPDICSALEDRRLSTVVPAAGGIESESDSVSDFAKVLRCAASTDPSKATTTATAAVRVIISRYQPDDSFYKSSSARAASSYAGSLRNATRRPNSRTSAPEKIEGPWDSAFATTVTNQPGVVEVTMVVHVGRDLITVTYSGFPLDTARAVDAARVVSAVLVEKL